MTAWMYRVGSAGVEADAERCELWLERAVEKGYAPAMNDLAATLLGDADMLERDHPELRVDASGAPDGGAGLTQQGRREGDDVGGGGLDGGDAGCGDGDEVQGRTGDGEEVQAEEDAGSLPPELAQLFEQVMGKRKRSMQLLQDAAKTGHTEAMTNLGNMQEAMGFLEDARRWYRCELEWRRGLWIAHGAREGNRRRIFDFIEVLS